MVGGAPVFDYTVGSENFTYGTLSFPWSDIISAYHDKIEEFATNHGIPID
jgi:hypothetical protein